MSTTEIDWTPNENQAQHDLDKAIPYIKASGEAVDFLKRSLEKLVNDARERVLVRNIDPHEREIRARVYHELESQLTDFLAKKESALRSLLRKKLPDK